MAIPLFTPDYLASPTMFGAINTKTAQLFLEEGARLSKKIEDSSSKAEAQGKAPAIATAYAEGLSAISQGNFDGFTMMGRAIAESAGNPFLMKMTSDAMQEATNVANNWKSNQMASKRLNASINAQDKIANRQAELGLINTDQAALKERDDENNRRGADYNKRKAAWIEEKKAKEDIGEKMETPEPEKPEPAIEPKMRSKTFGGPGVADLPEQGSPGLDTKDSLFAQVDPGSGIAAMPGTPTAGAPKATLVNENTASPAIQTPAPEKAVEKSPATTASETGWKPTKSVTSVTGREVPQVGEDFVSAEMGIMTIGMDKKHTPKAKLKRKTINTSYGSDVYEVPDDGTDISKNWESLSDAMVEVNSSRAGFAEWASKAVQQKDPIDFGEAHSDKLFYPQTKSGKAFGYMADVPGKNASGGDQIERKIVPTGVSEDIKKAWIKGQQAMGKLQGKLVIDFKESKYTDDQKSTMRSNAEKSLLKDLSAGKLTEDVLKEQNKNLNALGVEPFEMDQLKPKASKKSKDEVNIADKAQELGLKTDPKSLKNVVGDFGRDFFRAFTGSTVPNMEMEVKSLEAHVESLKSRVKWLDERGSKVELSARLREIVSNEERIKEVKAAIKEREKEDLK